MAFGGVDVGAGRTHVQDGMLADAEVGSAGGAAALAHEVGWTKGGHIVIITGEGVYICRNCSPIMRLKACRLIGKERHSGHN